MYDDILMSSDLDSFKNDGAILFASITFSGTLAAGAEKVESVSINLPDVPDFSQIVFDNSQKHSGKYKNLILEGITMCNETTTPSELAAALDIKLSGGSVTLTGKLFNPYGSGVSLQTTTIGFYYIPYIATF